ncbi:MAG: DUF4965 domain-containing protein [Chloroflexi bacterium]|uniref:DUF4965 domain-containing protein n=1 Tax=Candidatus Chlorohelix allophototropha TaxID=3003348 RepID=A0A8T7LZ78_9CHLR|nr:DUF4965 domain-containing protein [Chloroflexota bacterium]WJW65754.1 DUF4965 domain-containing protein [Chloroflexota bacterium L227-S17]
MLPIETMLGRLGSRFTLHFPRVSERGFLMGPLGKYYDRAWDFKLGVRLQNTEDGNILENYLPYTSSGTVFSEVEQEITFNSIKWTARDRAYNLSAVFKVTAPFYPRDTMLCTAPFFYIDAEIYAPPDSEPELLVGLADPTRGVKTEGYADGLQYTASYRMIPGHWGPRQPQDSLSDKRIFEAPITLSLLQTPDGAISIDTQNGTIGVKGNGGVVKASFILATFLAEPVLEVGGEPYRFKYLDFFKNIEEVWFYARSNEAEIRRKTALFDSLLADSSLDAGTRNLIAFSFQSYIPNSWWAIPGQNAQPEWYSVWEGNCTFHSTVDVEYNLAWFYLLLWDELLEMTLAEWRKHLKPVSEEAAFMSHDIGALLGSNCQAYPHEMEVEESANFILLAYALWRYSARQTVLLDNREAIVRLSRYILKSATTTSGFPTTGTANTVDDASPAVQFGREQIYLGVKALSALHVAALMLEESDKKLARECRARVRLICQTLEEQAWLGDHFAVCLDRTTTGLINPWNGQSLEEGELEGWNAYSLYTSNGLLYLLASGAPLPPLNLDLFRRDILEARRASLIEYGCTHSSSDHSHIWISQNLHRDLTGAYLGIDPADLPSRYWAFEQFENSMGRGGCFVDTYGSNHLHYYPRGVTSLGLLAAFSGAKFDRVVGKLEFEPVRVPLKVPLLALADWEKGHIPFVGYKLKKNKFRRSITFPELVEPYLKKANNSRKRKKSN